MKKNLTNGFLLIIILIPSISFIFITVGKGRHKNLENNGVFKLNDINNNVKSSSPNKTVDLVALMENWTETEIENQYTPNWDISGIILGGLDGFDEGPPIDYCYYRGNFTVMPINTDDTTTKTVDNASNINSVFSSHNSSNMVIKMNTSHHSELYGKIETNDTIVEIGYEIYIIPTFIFNRTVRFSTNFTYEEDDLNPFNASFSAILNMSSLENGEKIESRNGTESTASISLDDLYASAKIYLKKPDGKKQYLCTFDSTLNGTGKHNISSANFGSFFNKKGLYELIVIITHYYEFDGGPFIFSEAESDPYFVSMYTDLNESINFQLSNISLWVDVFTGSQSVDDDDSAPNAPDMNIIIFITIGTVVGVGAVAFITIRKKRAPVSEEPARVENIVPPATPLTAKPPKKATDTITEQEVVGYTEEEKQELEKTESEVGVEEQKIICIVHKGPIVGANIYACPSCKTFYCIKCATVLKENGEKCWSCDKDINV